MRLMFASLKLVPGRLVPCFALALLLLFRSTATALAEDRYFNTKQVDGIALLAPPPLAGSAEAAADLEMSRSVIKARTPAEEARALHDENLSLFNFTPAIGPIFQPGKFPKTEALFQKVKKEIGDAINVPKDYWKRQRPYQVDKELSFGHPEASSSYPSGHSTRGTVQALMLAELFPDKKEAIMEFGCTIGWDRVLMGKHFLTDVRAGRVLGQAIFRELMANPPFQHDLAEAKAEVQAALK